MIKILYLFIALSFLCISCQKKNDESLYIKQAFNNYKSAILEGRAEDAVKYVDDITFYYYEDILEDVKTLDSSTLQKRPLTYRMTALVLRKMLSKEEIASYDGKDLMVYLIKKDLVDKDKLKDDSIGEVTVSDEGTAAKGIYQDNGIKAGKMDFFKEGKEWKLDLTSLMIQEDRMLKAMLKKEGISEAELIYGFMEEVTGETPGPEIWKPRGE